MTSSPSNLCGSCNACCRVFAIPEFKKPAGEWCAHCDIGKGCKTYNDRPARCVEFKCFWLESQAHKGAEFAPELRPDKSKVVFSPTTNERVMNATTMPGYPLAWQAPKVAELIAQVNRAGMAVAVGPPNADASLLIKPDGTRVKVKLTPPDEDGMQWSTT